MALMPRSKTKGKGPTHKSKSFKKNNKAALRPKTAGVKRKAAKKAAARRGGDAEMMSAEPSPSARKKTAKATVKSEAGGDDDDFLGMDVPDFEDELATGNAPTGAGDGKAATQQTQNQKKKQRRKKAQKRASAVEFEASREAAQRIAAADAGSQADWLWASYSAFSGAGADQRGSFDGSFVVPLSGAGGLEERLKAAAGAAWQAELASGQRRPNGSPTAILISSSAAGANDLIKQLPSLNQACKVAKLFARHFKVHEQQASLATTAPAIAVGTPHRLAQLATLGALRLDRLQLVLVDVGLDAKHRTILDIPETCGDFWRFFQQHWGPRLAARQTRVGLFNSQGAG